MRKLPVLLVALALSAGGGPAQAAALSCRGTSPQVSACTLTATATSARVDAYFAADLFAGIAEFRVKGPNGTIRATCWAHPGVSTCYLSNVGRFDPGDALTATVKTTGVGDWEFRLLY